MRYTLVFLLFIVHTLSFGQNTWHREDEIAVKIHGIKNTGQLVKEIQSYSFTNNWSRVRVAFQWINTNIKYDWQKFRSSKKLKYTPDETITKRKGICSDYALLFKHVIEDLGFETVIIEGNAKGFGYEQGDVFYFPDHAWNAIKDDSGKWHLFDVTWSVFYFDIDHEVMIYDHLPVNKKWQLMDSAITKKEFERMTIIPKLYIEHGIGLKRIKEACPSNDCALAQIFNLPTNFHFEILELPLLEKFKIGRTYKISIEDYKNCKLYLQDGLRTKKLDFKNSTHSTSFIPLHPSHL